MHAVPVEWQVLQGKGFHRYGTPEAFPEVVNAHRRIEAAACRGLEHTAREFFPPTRNTFRPSNAPTVPDLEAAAARTAGERGGRRSSSESVVSEMTQAINRPSSSLRTEDPND